MAETYSHITGKAGICVTTFLSLRNWKHLIPFMMIPVKVLRKRKKKNTNKSGTDLSIYAQAFQMFKGRKSLADVAIKGTDIDGVWMYRIISRYFDRHIQLGC
jgi:hypothetical protein